MEKAEQSKHKESQKFSQFLAKHSGKNKKIAIAMHSRADADAISSAYALSRVIPNSVICIDEEMGEDARLLVQKLDIETKINEFSEVNKQKQDFEGLLLVDTSAYTLVPKAKGWKILCIIDHHRSDGRDIKGEFEIIDEKSPSSAEIIAGIISNTKAKIDKKIAFALSVGIISDGARFKSARANTFETLAKLMKLADAEYSELLSFAEPEPKAEAKIAMLTAMKRVNFIYTAGYIVATSEVGSNESDAAALISEAADVAFVAKWKDSEKETRISARARKGVKVPLNKVMAEVAKNLGGAGGGHPKAAGAALKAHTDEALKKCIGVFISTAENDG